MDPRNPDIINSLNSVTHRFCRQKCFFCHRDIRSAGGNNKNIPFPGRRNFTFYKANHVGIFMKFGF